MDLLTTELIKIDYDIENQKNFILSHFLKYTWVLRYYRYLLP
jgi:hypothetical protein